MSGARALLDVDDPSNGKPHAAIRQQEFFLPIHGYVRLWPEEVAIVNHPAFQRLRLCRQLGFAHLVFPGAVHTRFEHSIGATYVADKIIQYVNFNHDAYRTEQADGKYEICKIEELASRFVRLGALLHDIGHIPLGHTLEDELEHLAKHDGEERVDSLGTVAHPGYRIDPSLRFDLQQPPGGWSLKALINGLYQEAADQLFRGLDETLTPYDVVKLITLKGPPKAEPSQIKDANDRDEVQRQIESWERRQQLLAKALPISVCRDIIGNTICADFLDYLFRDWYHVGKPMTEDRRLYQYMEVRAPKGRAGELSAQEFVINVGPDQKLRHDALTSIFELLEGRYKLAETVLFHRTKLAMTALLDRCFLELKHLYEQVGLKGRHNDPAAYLADCALGLLMKTADDQLPSVIRRLSEGVTESDQKALSAARARFNEYVTAASESANGEPRLELMQDNAFDAAGQQAIVRELSERLENRSMYTLAYRLPRRGLHSSDKDRSNPQKLPDELRSLARPDVRRKQIVMLENLLRLPSGAITLYAPSNAKMNAKIAEVKLLIDDRIESFSAYERRTGDDALTGGVLAAQVLRFYELWGVSIYIDRQYAHAVRGEFRRFLKACVYVDPGDRNHLRSMRNEIEGLVRKTREEIRSVAARGFVGNSGLEAESSTGSTYSTDQFVSGLPYAAA